MSCNLKLFIPKNKIQEINKELFKNYEISGIIVCNDNNEVTGIQTPNNVINFHTHPLSAYKQGDTIWGWPSGEDIRETVKFGLAGNKAHMVFTMEGVYTIQISPCKLKKIISLLNNNQRGILIFLLEEYFKTTHNFRGNEEVKNLNNKGINITPWSYVDFINNFDLSCLMSSKTILHKKSKTVKNEFGEYSRIPNIGFPELEDNYITNVPLKEYISTDDLKELRPIDKHGNETNGRISKNEVMDSIKDIFKIFNVNKCNSSWNNNPNSWFYVNFFEKENNSSNNSSNNSKVFIKIFSNKTNGCSITQMGKINNFEIKPNKINSRSSSFGIGEITPQQRFLLYHIMIEHNIDDMEFLLNKVNEIIINNKLKISLLNMETIQNELDKIKTILSN